MLKDAILAALFVVMGLTLLAACGGDSSSPAPTATADPAAGPTSTPEPTVPAEFEGTRGPVEVAPTGETTAVFLGLRADSHADDGFDRVVFDFDDALPGYRIEYVERPVVACGSGLPVEVTGEVLLQVRTSPATTPSTTTTTVAGMLTGVALICNFEGEVTHVLAFEGDELDFRVFELEEPFRLVIDLEHR